MRTHAKHIHDLDFISDRLKAVFQKNSKTNATNIPIREIIKFRKQLRTWNKAFPRPPGAALVNCRLKDLQTFYSFKLVLSIFDGFPPEDRRIIGEEIAAYAAREALDSFYGYRLRNLANIGIVNPRWPVYLAKVREYYEKVIPKSRKEKIAQFQAEFSQLDGEVAEKIAAKCMGELFFDVDRIRLMSNHAFEAYLNEIREEVLTRKRKRQRTRTTTPQPEFVRECFDYLGLSYPVELYELKNRYRELARIYHPDKGGRSEQMQRLNAAYRVAVKYVLR